MIRIVRVILVLTAFTLCIDLAKAGNPDRAGEAGAYELLINPWARSSGLMGMNSSRIEGIEAMRLNVAGLAFAKKTEAIFSRTHWFQGSEVFVNAFGVAQKMGKSKADVIGLSFMALDFGDIEVTTASNPEGGLGTFKPQFFNIGVAYSRAFSNSIYAGAVVRVISERIQDLRAFGFAIDMGIQYVTGPLDNLRFGIALRNVGTPMKFSGDGLTFRGQAPEGTYLMSQNQRTEKYELPSLLNIGVSYDLFLDNIRNDKSKYSIHRLSIMANFTSNSFGKDHVGGGLEYSYREYFMVRAGYRWEDGITRAETRTSDIVGFGAGVSGQVPLKKDGPSFGVDYSYQVTSFFKGIHTWGIRFNL